MFDITKHKGLQIYTFGESTTEIEFSGEESAFKRIPKEKESELARHQREGFGIMSAIEIAKAQSEIDKARDLSYWGVRKGIHRAAYYRRIR